MLVDDLRAGEGLPSYRDQTLIEESLPAAVELRADGTALSRGTNITDTRAETFDDK